jgi:uncharacterized protein (TIRG00374 family)
LRKTVLSLSLFVGIALFAIVVARAGPARILADIGRLNAAQFAALIALRAVFWVLRTFNWKQVYDCYGPRRPFRRLFEARLADNAVSFLTPSAMLGGLPVRAMMLEGVDRRRALASVILDKTIEGATMAAYTIMAMLAALLTLPMSDEARLAFIAFIVLAATACVVLLTGQRRGLLLGFFDRLGRLGIRPRWAVRKRDSLEAIDAAVAEFYRDRRPLIPAIVGLYTLSYLVWAVEIHVTLRFLGAPDLTLFKSLLVISLGNVALLLPTVPASLGVYELTNVGVFAILGWPAGLAVALSVIRRLLGLAWTAVGLLLLFLRQWKPGVPRAEEN